MQAIAPRSKMLKPTEIAAYLRIARSQVHKITEHDPSFPKPIRIGSAGIRFRRDEFEKWLEERGRWPEAPPERPAAA